jgi:hypothetical protein
VSGTAVVAGVVIEPSVVVVVEVLEVLDVGDEVADVVAGAAEAGPTAKPAINAPSPRHAAKPERWAVLNPGPRRTFLK